MDEPAPTKYTDVIGLTCLIIFLALPSLYLILSHFAMALLTPTLTLQCNRIP